MCVSAALLAVVVLCAALEPLSAGELLHKRALDQETLNCCHVENLFVDKSVHFVFISHLFVFSDVETVVGVVWSVSSDLKAEKFLLYKNGSIHRSLSSDGSHDNQPIHDSCPTCQRSCDQSTPLSSETAPQRVFPSLEVCIAAAFHQDRMEVQNIPLPECNVTCSVAVSRHVYFLCDDPAPSTLRHFAVMAYTSEGWQRMRPLYNQPLPSNGVLFLFNDMQTSGPELYYAYVCGLDLCFQSLDGAGYILYYTHSCGSVVAMTTIGDQELLLECSNLATSDVVTSLHRFDFSKKVFHMVAEGVQYSKSSLRFSSDESIVAVCGSESVMLFDLQAVHPPAVVKVDGPVFDCVFTVNGSLVYANQNGISVVNFDLSSNNSGGVIPQRIDQSERFVCSHIGCPLLSTLGPNIVISTGESSIAFFQVDPPMFLDSAPLSHPSSRLVSVYNGSGKVFPPSPPPTLPPSIRPKSKSIVATITGSVVGSIVLVLVVVIVLIAIVLMNSSKRTSGSYDPVQGDQPPRAPPEDQEGARMTIGVGDDAVAVEAVQHADNELHTNSRCVPGFDPGL